MLNWKVKKKYFRHNINFKHEHSPADICKKQDISLTKEKTVSKTTVF